MATISKGCHQCVRLSAYLVYSGLDIQGNLESVAFRVNVILLCIVLGCC